MFVKNLPGNVYLRLPIVLVLRFLFASAFVFFADPFIAYGMDAAAAIPSGTAITSQNWQSYRQFMSDGLIALFEGTSFWRLPVDLRLEVGLTTSIPLPKKYRDDTARFSGTVQLVQTAKGGYVPSGYRAGLPFPHPLDGDPALIGERVFWNSYYRYRRGGKKLRLSPIRSTGWVI
jgi:hypothetical protein